MAEANRLNVKWSEDDTFFVLFGGHAARYASERSVKAKIEGLLAERRRAAGDLLQADVTEEEYDGLYRALHAHAAGILAVAEALGLEDVDDAGWAS